VKGGRWAKTGSSFGNFVFWDYAVLPELGIHGKADLYLNGEDGL